MWFSECPSMKERLNAPLWNAAGKSIHPTLAVAWPLALAWGVAWVAYTGLSALTG